MYHNLVLYSGALFTYPDLIRLDNNKALAFLLLLFFFVFLLVSFGVISLKLLTPTGNRLARAIDPLTGP